MVRPYGNVFFRLAHVSPDTEIDPDSNGLREGRCEPMKIAVSMDLVRFVFVVCALAAVCAPTGGLWLASRSPMAAYRYSDILWFLWIGGNLGSLIWSILFLRREPALARMSLFAVAVSLLIGACLPRL